MYLLNIVQSQIKIRYFNTWIKNKKFKTYFNKGRSDRSQVASSRQTLASMDMRCISKSYLIELWSLFKIKRMLSSILIIVLSRVSTREKIDWTHSIQESRKLPPKPSSCTTVMMPWKLRVQRTSLKSQLTLARTCILIRVSFTIDKTFWMKKIRKTHWEIRMKSSTYQNCTLWSLTRRFTTLVWAMSMTTWAHSSQECRRISMISVEWFSALKSTAHKFIIWGKMSKVNIETRAPF